MAFSQAEPSPGRGESIHAIRWILATLIAHTWPLARSYIPGYSMGTD